MRSSAFKLACRMGIYDCITKSNELFQGWMRNPSNNAIPLLLRAKVYCTAIKSGDQAEFDFLFNQYKKNDNSKNVPDLLNGLSCAKESWQLEKFLRDTFKNSNTTISCLRNIITKTSSHLQAWNFVKQNWEELYRRFNKDDEFKDVLIDFGTKFNTEILYTEVKQLRCYL